MENENKEISQDNQQKRGYYDIGEKTTAQFMLEEMGGKVVVPTNNDTNPLALRHAMTTDMDLTTMLMWLQAFSPIFAGMLSVSGIMSSIGLGFINKYMLLCILDAIFGIMDVFLLLKHQYDVNKLIFWAVWVPPVYMVKRKKLLGENNLHHIIWCMMFLILVIL